MTTFKFVGSHQEDLASGEIMTPGQEVELDHEALQADRNKQLIEDGKLIDLEATLKAHEQSEAASESSSELTGDALEQRAQELDVKGRSKMSADELRAAVAEAETQEGGD